MHHKCAHLSDNKIPTYNNELIPLSCGTITFFSFNKIKPSLLNTSLT